MELINDAADSGVRWKTPAASRASKTFSASDRIQTIDLSQKMTVGAPRAIDSIRVVPLCGIKTSFESSNR